MRFAWSKRYNLDIPVVDEQHKEFFEIVNAASELLESAEINKDSLLLLLEELSDHALYHFTTEEKYFREAGYDEADQHAQIHREFSQKILDFLDQVKLENDQPKLTTLAEEIVSYVVNWLTIHIVVEDKRYHDWILKQKK